MTYIYDLLLNWDEVKYYNFFEWEDDDEIEYIKKIPVFRIKNFDDLIYSHIKVDDSFLSRIYNKTEIYNNKFFEKIKYCCLFCSDNLSKVIAFEFDDDGKSIYKSNVSIYDLEDIFNSVRKTNSIKLNYIILSSFIDEDIYLTRLEKSKKRFLVSEIDKSYKENNYDKLRYIYYELFDEECENIDFIRNKIISSLNNNFNDKHDLIYTLIKTPKFL